MFKRFVTKTIRKCQFKKKKKFKTKTGTYKIKIFYFLKYNDKIEAFMDS